MNESLVSYLLIVFVVSHIVLGVKGLLSHKHQLGLPNLKDKKEWQFKHNVVLSRVDTKLMLYMIRRETTAFQLDSDQDCLN